MDMLQYTKEFDTEVSGLIESIRKNMLTPDEAMKCLAGWQLKNHPVHARMIQQGIREYDDLVALCRVEIDSRLDGFPGLSLKRHFLQ